MANQILHTRAKTPQGETKEEGRCRKSRESRLWPEATKPLPGDPKRIVALTLLNLRDASRGPDAETTPARQVVSREQVDVLSAWRHGEARPDWTVHEFFLALARLGGHQNRRKDKRPGWIVLWRGWTALQLLLTGSRLEKQPKKVG